MNFQPWAFVVVRDPEKLKALYDCYPREWFASAPVCIVVCGDHSTSWKRLSDNKDFCDVDIAITTEHLVLAAAEQGLGSCWVCNFDAPQKDFEFARFMGTYGSFAVGLSCRGGGDGEKKKTI